MGRRAQDKAVINTASRQKGLPCHECGANQGYKGGNTGHDAKQQELILAVVFVVIVLGKDSPRRPYHDLTATDSLSYLYRVFG